MWRGQTPTRPSGCLRCVGPPSVFAYAAAFGRQGPHCLRSSIQMIHHRVRETSVPSFVALLPPRGDVLAQVRRYLSLPCVPHGLSSTTAAKEPLCRCRHRSLGGRRRRGWQTDRARSKAHVMISVTHLVTLLRLKGATRDHTC